tara:strand:+ start:11127 stop:11501 length:375 start_codon:yes stop_codon:yes gene_type:complete
MAKSLVPSRNKLEREFNARIVTWTPQPSLNPKVRTDRRARPGGSCSCCGGGPEIDMDPPWYVYHAGIADRDGVFYSMLCQGCLEDIRLENTSRDKTDTDHKAELVRLLLPGDPDGQTSIMEDLS